MDPGATSESGSTNSRPQKYRTWEKVSGYFDGDGTPILTLAMYTVIPSIDWADSYRPQLEAVRSFLVDNGFRPTQTYAPRGIKPAWHLRLFEKGGLLGAMTSMLPFLCKKHDQIEACVDYMHNRLSGERLVEIFNRSTEEGTRSGFIKKVSMPYTHQEGVAFARGIVAKGKYASNILTEAVLAEIQVRRSKGETLRDISFSYHVSRSSIRRAFIRLVANDSTTVKALPNQN